MQAAGMSAVAIHAFLYQYHKLELNEAGLISESSISPLGAVPSIEDETVSGDTSQAATQTVVLKLNGGLGTGMGLEKAKSLLKVRDQLTFLDIISTTVFAPARRSCTSAQADPHEQFQHEQRYGWSAGGLSRTWRSQRAGIDAKQSAKD